MSLSGVLSYNILKKPVSKLAIFKGNNDFDTNLNEAGADDRLRNDF